MLRVYIIGMTFALVFGLSGCGKTPTEQAVPLSQPAQEQAAPPAATGGGDDSAPEAPSSADAIAQWKKAAAAEPPDIETCQSIAQYLSEKGSKELLPLLDVLVDPQQTPRTKVAVVDSLNGLLFPEIAERLIEIANTPGDTTARACAVHLLGSAPSEAGVAALRKLVSDPERRISFAALRGLAMIGSAEDKAKFAAMLTVEGTSVDERESIAGFFTSDAAHAAENIPILTQVLRDTQLDPDTRRLAVSALGMAGGADAIPPLKEAAEKDPEPYIREMAASAVKMLSPATEEQAALPAPSQNDPNKAVDPPINTDEHR